MFKQVRSQDVELDGITIMGTVSLAPAAVVKRFGRPSLGEGYKISGEYAFTNEKGEAFVLHDWLSTSLYYGAGEAQAPEEFWANTFPCDLSMASLDLDIKEFAEWLKNEVGSLA